MKQKFKNYLKLGILLFGISAIVTSCVKDDDFETTEISQEQQERGINVRTIYNAEIFNNPKIATQLNNGALNLQPNTIDNTSSARVVYNSNYQFYVDTDKASYTFAVTRDEDNGLVENLLLSLQEDGSYKVVLISYDLTDLEREKIQNNEIVDLANKVTYQLIEDDTISTNILSRSVDDDCFGFDVRYEMCCENFHSSLDILNGEQCICETPPTGFAYEISITVGCESQGSGFISDFNPVDTSPVPTGNGDYGLVGNPGGGIRDDNSESTISTNPAPDNPNNPQAPSTTIGGALTVVTFPDIEVETPCETLGKLSNTDPLSLNIKPIITTLKFRAKNAENEWSISIEKNINYGEEVIKPEEQGFRLGSSKNESNISLGTRNIGVLHSHPKETYNMFSWSDLRGLRNLYENITEDFRNDVFLMMVGHNEEVYALKINDFYALNQAIENDLNTTRGNTLKKKRRRLEKKLQDAYKEDSNIEKTFLEKFESYGVDVYVPATANFNRWRKLKVAEDDSGNDIVNREDCN